MLPACTETAPDCQHNARAADGTISIHIWPKSRRLPPCPSARSAWPKSNELPHLCLPEKVAPKITGSFIQLAQFIEKPLNRNSAVLRPLFNTPTNCACLAGKGKSGDDVPTPSETQLVNENNRDYFLLHLDPTSAPQMPVVIPSLVSSLHPPSSTATSTSGIPFIPSVLCKLIGQITF